MASVEGHGRGDAIEPGIRPLPEAPGLEEAFSRWSRSCNAFQDEVRRNPPGAPADKWQKLYYRGVGPDGERGPADHQSRLRLHPFAAPDAPPPHCPAHDPAPDGIDQDGR